MTVHEVGRRSPLGRRRFIAASVSSVAAPSLAGCGAPAPESRPSGLDGDRAILDRPIVDIHAHIFAANDLQGYQFITQVRMADVDVGPDLSGRLKAFLHALASVAEEAAPDLADERAYFDGGFPPERKTLQEVLQLTFARLRDGAFEPPPELACDPRLAAKLDALRKDGASAFSALGRALSGDNPARMAASAASLFQTHGTLATLARKLTSALEAHYEVVHKVLDFLRGFMESRFERVNLWATFMRGTREDNAAYPRFLVPAFIDFSYSLRDGLSHPRVPVAEMVEIMALVARRQPPTRIVHGHLPFNPWRLAKQSDREQRESFELIRHAIHDCGFLGVKIYPPMGFQGWGNDTLVPEQFNVHEDECRVEASFPAALDTQLTKLYDLCLAEDVPIMLHSGATNEAKKGWGYRADPQFWWPVLEKRPGLRVNFAHFGGGGFEPNDLLTGPQYMKSITAMMRKYRHVYADLGDYSLVLGGRRNQARLDEFSRRLADLTSAYGRDTLRDRLMFGTDWMFVSAIAGSSEFPQRMLGFMVDKVGAVDRLDPAPQGELREQIASSFAARNACRFLGFDDPRGKVLQRLKRFYSTHQLDRSTLDLFADIARGGGSRTVART